MMEKKTEGIILGYTLGLCRDFEHNPCSRWVSGLVEKPEESRVVFFYMPFISLEEIPKPSST